LLSDKYVKEMWRLNSIDFSEEFQLEITPIINEIDVN
jgi:hypothetical protein